MSITPQQITGAFFYAGGSPLAGAQLTLTLSQSAVLNDGSGSVATPEYIVTLGSDGTIPSDAEIFYNDDLLPNGTYYTWQICGPDGTVYFGPVSAQIVGTAPVNLNTTPPLSNVIQPTPAPSAFGPLTVVQPTGTNLHVVVDSGASGATASDIAAAIVSNPPTVDIKSSTVTALTPPTASAIGSAVAAPSASAIGTAIADDLLIGTQAAGSSVPVALPTATISTLTPPTASAIGTAVAAPSASAVASAIVGNPPTVGIAAGTVTTLTPPSASAIASAIVSNPPTVAIGSATPAGFHISSNAVQAIKSSAGVLRGYFLDNTANSATSYFQFFNVAAGSVTLGSTAPLFVIPIPAGLAANLAMPGGWTFSTAMSFAITTTYSGSTAPSSACNCTIAYV